MTLANRFSQRESAAQCTAITLMDSTLVYVEPTGMDSVPETFHSVLIDSLAGRVSSAGV